MALGPQETVGYRLTLLTVANLPSLRTLAALQMAAYLLVRSETLPRELPLLIERLSALAAPEVMIYAHVNVYFLVNLLNHYNKVSF